MMPTKGQRLRVLDRVWTITCAYTGQSGLSVIKAEARDRRGLPTGHVRFKFRGNVETYAPWMAFIEGAMWLEEK